MDKKINIALVGLGAFGKKYYKNIKKNKKFLLKAIFKKKINKRNSLHKNLSLKEIDNCKIQAAIICTPIKTHFQIAKKFIEKKIPIILEKPAGKNIKEIKKLMILSKKNKSSVIINHSDFYNKNFQQLVINKKYLGKINSIEAYFGRYSEKYTKDFYPYKDWIVHPIAIILQLANITKLKIIHSEIQIKNKKIFQSLNIEFIFNKKDKGKIFFWNNKRKKSRLLIVNGLQGVMNYDGIKNSNNFIELKKKRIFIKNKISPMENVLNKLYFATIKKRYVSDLSLALKIEKITNKIKL